MGFWSSVAGTNWCQWRPKWWPATKHWCFIAWRYPCINTPWVNNPLSHTVNNPLSHTPMSPTQPLSNEQMKTDFQVYFVLQDLAKCTAWDTALPCLHPNTLIPFPEKFTALLRFSRFNSIMFPGAGRREQKQRNQSLHERQAWTSARTNTPKLWEGCISIFIRKAHFCQMFTSLFFPALPSEGSRTFPEAQRAFLCKSSLYKHCGRLPSPFLQWECPLCPGAAPGAALVTRDTLPVVPLSPFKPFKLLFVLCGLWGFPSPTSHLTPFSDCWTVLGNLRIIEGNR